MGGFWHSSGLCRHGFVVAGAFRFSVFWLMPGFRSARRAAGSTESRKTQHPSDRSGLFEQFPQARNVQKQSRICSSGLEMIVAEHSAETLTSFHSSVRSAKGAERPQQAVF